MVNTRIPSVPSPDVDPATTDGKRGFPLSVLPGAQISLSPHQVLAQVRKMGNDLKKVINGRYSHVEIDIDGIFKMILLLAKKKVTPSHCASIPCLSFIAQIFFLSFVDLASMLPYPLATRSMTSKRR